MTQAYRITNWVQKFEVLSNGQATKLYDSPPAVDKLRNSPLPYIRMHNTGHAITDVERNIIEQAWRAGEINELAVEMLYWKLCRIAGNQRKELRGWVLDSGGRPLNITGIAAQTGVHDVPRLRQAIQILCDPAIGLVQLCEFGQTYGSFYKINNLIEDYETLYKKESESNELKLESCPKADNDSFAAQIDSDSTTTEPSVEQIKQVRSDTSLKLCEIFRLAPSSSSDISTFRDILNQLEEMVIAGQRDIKIFDAMVDEARGCTSRNRKGEFVNIMKSERFGYVPVRQGWLNRIRR